MDDVGRATILSGVSMVLSLAAGAANLLGGWIAAITGPIQFLAVAGVAVAAAGGLLWMLTSPIRPADETTATDAGKTVTTD
jgi:predicted phage tail protein